MKKTILERAWPRAAHHIRCHAARTPSSRGLAAHVNASSSQASRTHHEALAQCPPSQRLAASRRDIDHACHACSRHACIASSVVGLAARRGHVGGSWSGPSSHRCAQARGPQPLKHRAKQPSTGHPRCRQARARADTGWSQHKHRSSTGAEMVWCGLGRCTRVWRRAPHMVSMVSTSMQPRV